MKNAFTFWKYLLSIICIFLIIHFVKDITQDLLSLKTIFDKLGNIVENTSHFPQWLLYIYHWGWINAIIFQLLVPYLHFKNIGRSEFKKIDYYILVMIGWITLMTFWAFALT